MNQETVVTTFFVDSKPTPDDHSLTGKYFADHIETVTNGRGHIRSITYCPVPAKNGTLMLITIVFDPT